jgi:hypothetical protein
MTSCTRACSCLQAYVWATRGADSGRLGSRIAAAFLLSAAADAAMRSARAAGHMALLVYSLSGVRRKVSMLTQMLTWTLQ